MLNDSIALRKEMGIDKYYSRVQRAIFSGDIEPMFGERKTWAQIDKALQAKYGAIGEEAYLVTRAAISYQMKQWEEFTPLAKILLKKYSGNLSEESRKNTRRLLMKILLINR